MPRLSLTSKLVDNAPLPRDRKSVEYFDQRMPGLVLRVSGRGTKSWNAIYRHQGRARRLTIGRYPIITLDDARARARDALCAVSRGIDPSRVRADKLTFAELASIFVEGHVRKLRRARQVERLIEREIVAAWKNRPANSITRRDVALLVADVAERAPVLANRVLANTRRLFGWAIAQGLLETDPCDRVERPTFERARERVLASGELRALWQAFDSIDPSWAALFRLCLLTGQRVGEVLCMRWSNIDDDCWIVPSTTAKNGLSHRVPLSPRALQVLLETPRRGGYVFCASSEPSRHLRGYRKAFTRACTIAGIENARPHDLRRTAATMIASTGVSRVVIGRILNHAERGVTAVYDRYSYDAEKRAALNLWSERLVDAVK
jgi:integrase